MRTSKRLTRSPAGLSADSSDLDPHLVRLLKQHGQLNQEASCVLKVNPKHPLVRKLSEKLGNGGNASEMKGMD